MALSSCCKLINLVSPKRLIKILERANKKKITVWGSGQGDTFDLTNEADGYPCIYLIEDGCKIHNNKFKVCNDFPQDEDAIDYISTCSYSFDENGNRFGTCDKCSKSDKD